MGKICTILDDLKNIEVLDKYVDAYIIPVEDFSINYPNYFKIEEINKIKTNKEIFVSLNKNIHNNELEKLKEILFKLKNIKGIIFYDIALVILNKELNFDLIWAQEHLTTNYMTINYWNQKGSKGAYLSSEITKEEIEEIITNTNCKLFLNVFGYQPIFTSKRNLVNNYLETFNIESKNNYKIYKEGKTYPIIDEKHGTTVYTNYILNIYEEVKSLNIDYLVFNPFNIEKNKYIEVLKSVKENKEIPVKKELGFLDKETIYKVKNNE